MAPEKHFASDTTREAHVLLYIVYMVKKSSTSQNIRNLFVINIILLALLKVTFVVAVQALQRIKSLEDNSMVSGHRTYSDIARIRFCHDRQIVPCDDPLLEKWNAEHPEDRFNVYR